MTYNFKYLNTNIKPYGQNTEQYSKSTSDLE